MSDQVIWTPLNNPGAALHRLVLVFAGLCAKANIVTPTEMANRRLLWGLIKDWEEVGPKGRPDLVDPDLRRLMAKE